MNHEEAVTAYEALSESFTALNKEFNRAVKAGTVTDELELKFMRAEKALKEAYAKQAAIAAGAQ